MKFNKLNPLLKYLCALNLIGLDLCIYNKECENYLGGNNAIESVKNFVQKEL